MTRRFPSAGLSTAFLRRHPFLVVAVVSLIVVRAFLPMLLRPVLERQASALVEGEVRIGDLDLWFLRPAIALDEVRVFEAGNPEESVVGWKTLYVRVGWLDLFRRTLRIRSLDIEAPEIRVDRLEGGELNLARLVPAGNGEASAAPAEGSWTLAIDGFDSHAGQVEVRDLTLPTPQGVTVRLDEVSLDHVAFSPGVYERPSSLEVRGRIDDAPMTVVATAAPLDAGWRLDASLELRDLRLHPARAYLPAAPWRDFAGLMDLDLAYAFEPDGRHEASGEFGIRDFSIRVPGVEAAPIAWKALRGRIAKIDFRRNDAALESVVLEGASVVARRDESGLSLPFLPLAPDDPAAPEGSPEEAAEASAWRWEIGRIEVGSTTVSVLSGDSPLEAVFELGVERLGSDTEAPASFRMSAREGDGSVEASGTLRLVPLGVEAAVEWKDVSLPRLSTLSPIGMTIRGGQSEGRLDVKYGESVGGAGGPQIGAHGRLAIVDLATGRDFEEAGEEEGEGSPEELSVAFDRLEVDAEEISADTADGSLVVRLRSLSLSGPKIGLAYDEEGLVLGPRVDAPPVPESSPDEVPEGTYRVALAELRLENGTLEFVDRSMKPFFRGALSEVNGSVRDLAWPELRIARFELTAVPPDGGTVKLEGDLTPEQGEVRIEGERVGLGAFNPYVRKHSGYSIRRGAVSVGSKVRFDGNRFRSKNSVSLHEFELKGAKGKSLFQEQFGVPLSLALALMRDIRGDIHLDVPVSGSGAGATLDLFSVIGGALRSAIMNAVVSPLKILGAAVTLSGEKIETFELEPIRFIAGTSRLVRGSTQQIDRVGGLLASRSGLIVRLTGGVDESDVRRLREEQILAGLREDESVEPSAAASGPRQVIRAYLEAKTARRDATLPGAERGMLEALVRARGIPEERLRELAASRAERVRRMLEERHGLTESVVLEAPSVQPGPSRSGVTLDIGVP